MNLPDSFRQYLVSQPKAASKTTVKNYTADINQFIRWCETIQHRSFDPIDLNENNISSYKNYLSRTASQSSKERKLSSLRKFSQFLIEIGKIHTSPFTHLNAEEEHKDLWLLQDFRNSLIYTKSSSLTVKNYINDIKQFIEWTANNVPYTHDISTYINSGMFTSFRDSLKESSSFSETSINRKLSSLRRYAAFALERGLLENKVLVSNINLNDSKQSIVNNAKSSLVEPIREAQKQEVDSSEDSSGAQPYTSTTEPYFISEKNLSEDKAQSKPYSKIPPLRLMQKINWLMISIFDFTIVRISKEILEKLTYSLWLSSGKQIFIKSARNRLDFITNLNDSIRASLKPESAVKDTLIGTLNGSVKSSKTLSKLHPSHPAFLTLPRYLKILGHIFHTRPKWYNKYHSFPLVHYLHFAALIIIMSALGVSGYTTFVSDAQKNKLLAATPPNAPPRILSFQGRLTDSNDNPITLAKDLRFAIYSSSTASGGALLWQETQKITPDQDGIFSVLLGSSTSISSTVFTDQTGLYLGVTVQSDSELSPRQQIATVAFAANSETLQGLSPITAAGAGTSNVVLALDSSGNLTIGGSANPTFTATGGNFTLSGKTLNLSSTAGSNGSVSVTPDGQGLILLNSPIQNSTSRNNIATANGAVEIDDLLAVLATSSGQSAFTLNQNSTGPLISASSSGVAKFTVDYLGNGYFAGNVGVGSTSPTAALDVVGKGKFTSTVSGANATLSNEFVTLSQLTTGTGQYWQKTAGAISPAISTDDVLIGSTSTSSAKFGFINIASGTPTATISSNFSLQVPTGSSPSILLNTINGGSLNFQTAGLGQGDAGLSSRLYVANNGNIGISSTLPAQKLDVVGNFKLSGTTTFNSQTYTWPSSAGTNGYALTTNGSGTLSWTAVSGGTNYWQLNSNALSPSISTYDVLFGSTATTSAKFALLNMAGGTPVASAAGNFIVMPYTSGAVGLGGNVGIGTTSPQNNLHMYGGGGNVGIRIETASDIKNPQITFWKATQSAALAVAGIAGNWSNTANPGDTILRSESGDLILASRFLNSGTSSIRFTTTNGSAKDSERMRLGSSGGLSLGESYIGNDPGAGSMIISGNLGVGTTNPTAKLMLKSSTSGQFIVMDPTVGDGYADIAGANYNTGIRLYGGTSYATGPAFQIWPTGSIYQGIYFDAGTATGADINFRPAANDSTVAMIIKQGTGRVGINTTSPITTFDVRGTSGTLSVASASGRTSFATLVANNDGVGDLFTASASGWSRFVIRNNGNVGIGSILPTQALDVVGNFKLSGTTTFNSQTYTWPSSAGTNGYALTTNGSGTLSWTAVSGGTNYWQLNSNALSPSISTYDVLFGSTATTSAKFALLNMAGGTPVASAAGNFIVMPYTSGAVGLGGNVGIGTTNPLYKLDVTGEIRGAAFYDASNPNLYIDPAAADRPSAKLFSPVGIGTTDVYGYLTVVGSTTTTQGQALIQFNQTGTTDILTASSSGTTKFIINNAGNVGIGIISPLGLLNVNGAATGKALAILNQTGDQDLFTASASGSTRFTITNSGDVAFNSSSPAIYQTASTARLQFGIGTIAAPTGAYFQAFGNNFATSAQRGGAEFVFDTRNSGTGGFSVFSYDGSTWTNRFKVDSTGNVGIGATTIRSALDVVGSASLSANLSLRGSGTAHTVNILDGGTLNIQGSAGGDTGLTSRLYITSNGNVGIGTTSLSSKFNIKDSSSLAVLGSEKITNSDDRTFTTNTGNWTGSGWAVNIASSGKAVKDTPGSKTLTLTNSALDSAAASGYGYQITLTYTTEATSSGYITMSIGGVTGNGTAGIAGQSSTVTYNVLTAVSSSALSINAINDWYGTIDDISVKQITPTAGTVSIFSSDGTGTPIEIRTGGSGTSNTLIGDNSGKYLNIGAFPYGYQNTALGNSALRDTTTGYNNTAIGSEALRRNVTGSANTAIGFSALISNNTGSSNTVIGNNAMYYNYSGSVNVAIGDGAMYYKNQGEFNVAIGFQAGMNNAGGSNNVFIGNSAGYFETGSNKLYIANSYSKTLIYGDFARSSVGIGTTDPQGYLSVVGSTTTTQGQALIQFNQTGSADILTASASGNTKFVISNAGNVGIGTAIPTSLLNINGGNFTHIANGNPILKGSIDTTGNAIDVVVRDKYAYLTDRTGGFKIFDISDPANPALISTTYTFWSGKLSVQGNIAYISDDNRGVRVIDVSDPYTPTEIDLTDFGTTYHNSAYINGKTAYLAIDPEGLKIVDYSDLRTPKIIGTYIDSLNVSDVYVSGKFAYISEGSAKQIKILDISDPTNPTLVGSYTTTGNAYRVKLSGKYLYLAEDTAGLRILDVSNPANPTSIGVYDTPGTAYGLEIAGRYAYVADGTSGVLVIDISSPASPSLVGTYDTPGLAKSVTISGKYAYVADDTSGLIILDINGTETPSLLTGVVQANSINITDNASIQHNLSVGNGINIGKGGLFTTGSVSLMSTESAQLSVIGKQGGQAIAIFNQLSSSDILTASVSGSTKFVISNAGNVGIGTTTTRAALDIVGSASLSANFSLRGTNTAHTFNLLDNGTLNIQGSVGGDAGLPSNSRFFIASTGNGGNIGIGSTSPLGLLNVNGAATGKALTILNQIGNQDLFTASKSGVTRFTISNSGGVLMEGDTTTSIGSTSNGNSQTETNNSAVANGIGDQGSIIPNAGFESNITSFKNSGTADPIISDGWTSAASQAAAVVRIATDSAQGDSSIMFKLNASQVGAVDSVCIPLASQSAYTLNFYAKPSMVNTVVARGYIYYYNTKANCQANTSPSFSAAQGGNLTSVTTWTNTPANTTPITGPATGNQSWARVHIFAGCPASCATGTIVYIDGVRLIQATSGWGLDYAENYPADPNHIPEAGDVVSLVSVNGATKVAPANEYMSGAIIGVVSTKPGMVLDDGSVEDPKVPIALAGRIPVKVSTKNGVIRVGDALTSSDIPGVAVKAISSGPIIGYAMEEYLEANITKIDKILLQVKNSYIDTPTSSVISLTGTDTDDFKVWAEQYQFQNKSGFAEAVIARLTAGFINAQKIIVDGSATFIGTIQAQAINATSISVQSLTFAGQSLHDYILAVIQSSGFTTKTINSPIATIDQINANVISPLSSDSVDVKGNLTIKKTSTNDGNLTVEGSATISGQLSVATASISGQLLANDASIAGTLRAGRIIADDIEGLNARIASIAADAIAANSISSGSTSALALASAVLPSASGSAAESESFAYSGASLISDSLYTKVADIASLSALIASVPSLTTENAQINQGLMVFGTTSLSDTAIAGQLSVNGSLIIAENSINVLGSTFEIQPLRQGNVSFQGGLVAIDTDGNFTVQGNATFAKDVTVNGTISAKIVSPVPDEDLIFKLPGDDTDSTKLAIDRPGIVVKNGSGSAVLKITDVGDVIASGAALASQFQVVRSAQADISSTQTIATASAGSAIIKLGQYERTIVSPYVTSESLIYITPATDTDGAAPFIARQTAEDKKANTKGSFTIRIPVLQNKDIKVNWWIIN